LRGGGGGVSSPSGDSKRPKCRPSGGDGATKIFRTRIWKSQQQQSRWRPCERARWQTGSRPAAGSAHSPAGGAIAAGVKHIGTVFASPAVVHACPLSRCTLSPFAWRGLLISRRGALGRWRGEGAGGARQGSWTPALLVGVAIEVVIVGGAMVNHRCVAACGRSWPGPSCVEHAVAARRHRRGESKGGGARPRVLPPGRMLALERALLMVLPVLPVLRVYDSRSATARDGDGQAAKVMVRGSTIRRRPAARPRASAKREPLPLAPALP